MKKTESAKKTQQGVTGVHCTTATLFQVSLLPACCPRLKHMQAQLQAASAQKEIPAASSAGAWAAPAIQGRSCPQMSI